MTKTSWWQKCLIIFTSIIISLILLEGFLRVAGFLFLFSQERQNIKNLGERDVFVILCLGESTTALGDEFSYPHQLEQILNERSKSRRAAVINKGIPAINMQYIYDNLDKNLDKYHPDLVITMIGINDEYNEFSPQYIEESERGDGVVLRKKSFYDSLRVVKLFKLLRSSLRYKVKEIDYNDFSLNEEADTSRPKKILYQISKYQDNRQKLEKIKITAASLHRESAVIENIEKQIGKNKEWEYYFTTLAGHWYSQQKDYKKAEDYYRQAILFLPEEERAYLELGVAFREQKKYNEALKMLKTAVKANSHSFSVMLELAKTLTEIKDIEGAKDIYTHLLTSDIKDYWNFMEIGDWFVKYNMPAEAKEAYLKAGASADSHATMVYYKLGDIYKREGAEDKAREFYRKAEEDLAESNHVDIFRLYNMIAAKILNRRIPLISMQYPLRSNDLLKRNLKRRNEIIFDENKSNFEEALKTSRYSEYFYDNFGGDMGHCTLKGNRLIVEQLSNIILRDVFREKK